MNESLGRVLASLSDPSKAGPELADVESLAREYPFFVFPAVMALRDRGAELDGDTRGRLMSLVAFNSPEPQAMFTLADIGYDEWARFYPDPRAAVTTDDAITRFLETYGHADPREEALLERLIFNPTPDYSSILAREEEGSVPAAPADPADMSQDALISSFILKHRDDGSSLLPREEHVSPEGKPEEETAGQEAPAVEHHAPAPAAPAGYDSSLSESLAKIYIRQKRYDKAFEIIHTLSLNNPKKSAYFADQLRFLRKLMLNRESANKNK